MSKPITPENVEKCLQKLTKLPIIRIALDSLSNNLPPNLKYHIASHTDDVLHETVVFAMADGLDDRTVEVLAVAAAYHDLGFIVRPDNNEEIGAQLAQKAMRDTGNYTASEIKQVGSMIIDTRVQFTAQGMRQIPTDDLAAYLLDADVSNLGRDDFFDKAEAVRQEIGMESKAEFKDALIKFVEAHRWYTPAAIAMRQKKKDENYKKLTSV